MDDRAKGAHRIIGGLPSSLLGRRSGIIITYSLFTPNPLLRVFSSGASPRRKAFQRGNNPYQIPSWRYSIGARERSHLHTGIRHRRGRGPPSGVAGPELGPLGGDPMGLLDLSALVIGLPLSPQ